MYKIFFAADHAGFALKNALIDYARSLGHDAEDLGAFTEDPQDDYPDFVTSCAYKVAATAGSFGVILGKSGQGEAMAANRIKGVRAAVYYGGPHEAVSLAREHNDANVLSLGAGFIREEEAKEAVALFLSTPFSGEERHIRRLEKF